MKFRWVMLGGMSLLVLSLLNIYIERPRSSLFDRLIVVHNEGGAEWNAPVDLLMGNVTKLRALDAEIAELLADGFYLSGFYVENTYVFNPRHTENICQDFQRLAVPSGSLSLRKKIDLFFREYTIKIVINSDCKIVEVIGFKLKPAHP